MRLCATPRTQDAKMVQVQSQSYSLDLAGTHSRDASNCDLRNRCEEFCDGLPPVLSLWQLRQVMAVGKLLSAITLWRSALTEFRIQLALPGPQPQKPTLLPQPVAATKERLDVKATYTK